MTQTVVAILIALALDRFIPDRGGLNVFGWYRDWADSIEQRFNGGTRAQGVGAVLLATIPMILGLVLVRYVLKRIAPPLAFVYDVVILYLCLDLYHLGRSAVTISENLEHNDLPTAHEQLQQLTGKGAAELSEAGIAQAAVEGVLKLGNSLVIAPLFWFILLGPGGVLLQRIAAVLDRLWGHRDSRFAEFGWAAARLDDLLGWIPARITAVSYALMGSFEDALHCWRRQARMWSDINSGPVLASGFGAMHMYNCEETDDHDAVEAKHFRLGVVPDASHVRRAVALIWRVLLLWFVIALMVSGDTLFGIFSR